MVGSTLIRTNCINTMKQTKYNLLDASKKVNLNLLVLKQGWQKTQFLCCGKFVFINVIKVPDDVQNAVFRILRREKRQL